jgi:hypothetical protein
MGLAAPPPPCLRFEEIPYPSGEPRPAMLSAVHDIEGTLVAVQSTRLTREGDRVKLQGNVARENQRCFSQ